MKFNPLKSLSPEIVIKKNATILPFIDDNYRTARRPAGVFDDMGNYIASSQCFRSSSVPTTIQPLFESTDKKPTPKKHIEGTWLYGGMLYQHFGHFLVESTSRFWAIEYVNEKIDGVIFLPKKMTAKSDRYLKGTIPLLKMFGPDDCKFIAPQDPVSVEKLILAPQGFGMSDMIGGSPEYRTYMRKKFNKKIQKCGADKIYISRSKLYSKRGRYLCEYILESLLEKEGYRIFHPQEHSIEDQISQYKAANTIISCDSSALHLAAFLKGPNDKIAIISRRPGNLSEDFMEQFSHFSNTKPSIINVLNGIAYTYDGVKKSQMSEIYSELDFKLLYDKLFKLGFISSKCRWQDPGKDEVEADLKDLSIRLGKDIYLSPSIMAC